MKKTIFLAAIIGTLLIAVNAFAADAQDRFNQKKSIAEYVVGNDVISEDAESFTRSGFTKAAVRAIGYELDAGDFAFSDVPKTETEIYTAVAAGWIAKADEFRPDDEITVEQAAKIAVSALGYGQYADLNGGYPSGYIYMAYNAGLLKDVSSGGILSAKEGWKMIYNMLNSVPLGARLNMKTKVDFRNDETLLEQTHDIYCAEGILTSDNYTGLISDDGPIGDSISVDGRVFRYSGECDELLGTECKVYYKKDTLDVCLILGNASEKTELELRDITEIEDEKILYDAGSGKEKTIKTDKSRCVIFNGRKATLSYDLIKDKIGRMLLTDNDGDGKYDVINIYSYDYLTVKYVDGVNKYVIDTNSSKYTLAPIDEQKSVFLDENGEKISIYDIMAGDVLRVMKSIDGDFVRAVVLKTEFAKGKAESCEDGKTEIGGKTYYISPYFTENNAAGIKEGKEYTFITDGYYLISKTADYSEYQYAYLIKLSCADGDTDDVTAKLFLSNGKFLTAKLRQKVRMDGQSRKCSEVYNALTTESKTDAQLIRFAQNADGVINKIDIASTDLPRVPGEYPNPDNSLTKYPMIAGQYYKNVKACANNFHLADAVIFMVPSKADNIEGYKMLSANDIEDDQLNDGNFAIYDLSKGGGAQAAVYTTDIMAGKTKIAVIEKIVETIDEDDVPCNRIYLREQGRFASYNTNENMKVTGNNRDGKGFCPGDIVTFKLDAKERIESMTLVFDGQKMIPGTSVTFNANNSDRFQKGWIYSADGNYILASETKTDDEYEYENGPKFNSDALKTYNVNTSYIFEFNKDNAKVSPITKDALRSYLNSGYNADYFVLRQYNYASSFMVIYRDGE